MKHPSLREQIARSADKIDVFQIDHQYTGNWFQLKKSTNHRDMKNKEQSTFTVEAYQILRQSFKQNHSQRERYCTCKCVDLLLFIHVPESSLLLCTCKQCFSVSLINCNSSPKHPLLTWKTMDDKNIEGEEFFRKFSKTYRRLLSKHAYQQSPNWNAESGEKLK